MRPSGGFPDDVLAETADASSEPAGPERIVVLGPSLGRYRLEHELGTGAMGVVYAAFDPDLERRIALKVLRSSESDDARKRLLREARAMARLSHPNVVTVYEVGSAGGRDYVAMELVEGETLAEWLRGGQRARTEIVEAFVGAGRGLAAAHAAGIVHRDFKPHNVLRRKDGRIVVTDFGLARDTIADAELVERGAGAPGDRAIALNMLTISGDVLGTPAYMAVEQWRGEAATPASDQFAFCVGLWEALAGQRPFRGTTAESLQTEVERGTVALDPRPVPRRYRAILRRGLEADQARRWPSMDALLAGIHRADRRPRILLGLALAVGLAIVALGWQLRASGAASASGCPAPAIAAPVVWSLAVAADGARWEVERATACKLEPVARAARLACLDGVLARLVIASEVAGAADPALDAGAFAIDPVVCALPVTPRLVASTSPLMREAAAARMLAPAGARSRADRDRISERAARSLAEPCAGALGQIALVADVADPDVRARALDAATRAAEQCGDDRIRAEVALAGVRSALAIAATGIEIEGKLALAQLAIQRVAQPDLQAELDRLHGDFLLQSDRLDDAIAKLAEAVAGFRSRGRLAREIDAERLLVDTRLARGHDGDLVKPALLDDVRRRSLAVALGANHPSVRAVEHLAARWRFLGGDVAGAHAMLERLRQPAPNDPARRVGGRVVDARGLPVSGARVVVGKVLDGDSIGVARAWRETASIRSAATDAAGHFVIHDAPHEGVAVAQLADRRSMPIAIADDIELVLEPTSRISGKVELHGTPAATLTVYAIDLRVPPPLGYTLQAPVHVDGTFEIAGVPRTRVLIVIARLRVGVTSHVSKELVVADPVVSGLAFELARSRRVVYAILRSSVGVPLPNAGVRAVPGTHAQMDLAALSMLEMSSNQLARRVDTANIPPAVAALKQPGDLYGELTDLPDGPASACAFGLPRTFDASVDRLLRKHPEKIDVRCTPILPGATTAIVFVPPFPRLE